MFYRHYSDKLVYPILALILFLIVSYRPVYHLRPGMPQEFYAPSIAGAARPSEHEQRVAQAYWQSAQMNVQWKYAQGHPLPVDVPADFSVDQRALGPAASDPAVRAFYWRRLQLIYTSPNAWQKDYEWNFGWINDIGTSIADWVRDLQRNISPPGR